MRKANAMRAASFMAVALLSLQLGCDPQGADEPSALGTTEAAAYTGSGGDVMLQGFIWGSQSGWYGTLSSTAGTIKSGGFTMVWFPPPSKAGSTQGYLPTEWNNLSSSYGTQAQLQSAISAMHGQGLKVLADVVVNHRNGCTNWADFCNPAFPNNAYAVCSNDEWGQGLGAGDTGEGYGAARDLDHTNGDVQNGIKAYLSLLKSTGFDGWRYDYVKGFGGTYVGAYNSASAPAFSVGEFWPTNTFYSSDPANWRNQITGWIGATGSRSAAFDFVTKPLLQEAFNSGNYGLLSSSGRPAGVIGVNPGASVTFLDNHDTGPSPGGQGHWPFPSGNVEAGYAYILTHPGVPMVFWPHYFDWGSSLQTAIKNMIALRKAQGITATSSVSIQAADGSKYAAIVNGNTAVKIGPGAWSPSGTWTLALSGTNYAIWKSGGGGGGGGTATTTIRVHYDVGVGNAMYLRGSVAPLSWTAGVAATWTTGNVWVWSTTSIPSGTAFEYKALKNDSGWSDGANFTGSGGQTLDIYPTFNGNFYDTMDSITTNWAVTGGTTTAKWVQGTLGGSGVAQCVNCGTESQLTLKYAQNKTGTTVTLGFKYSVTGLTSAEYLKVDVLKGTTWYNVATYYGTVAATNRSINVTSYQSTAMKVRFRAKMVGSTKKVTVDNVTISKR